MVKTDGQGLTDRQLRFVEAISGGLSDEEALEAAGYASAQKLGTVAGSEAVQAALKSRRVARIKGSLAHKALEAVEALITDERTPAATRFAASRWVLEQAGHNSQDETGHDKPVGEMTTAELEAFIRRAEAVARGVGGSIIDVTPDSGAQR